MSTHTCKPDHAGILADDCERCGEHAVEPLLLTLDREKMGRLWDKMILVERPPTSASPQLYETENEATAARQLYKLAVWLERYGGVYPWGPLVPGHWVPLVREGEV